MGQVDYCVTTMNRPRALERLLFSIAAHRPDAPVHIADQSEDFDPASYEALADRLAVAGLEMRPTIHRLPFDCGIAVARNHLVDVTSRRYKLSLDDDFAFTERTDVDAMVRLLGAHSEAGLVGGCVTRNGQVRHVGTDFERSDTSLRQVVSEAPLAKQAGIRFRRAGCVPLFVLIREELFSHLRWDPKMKTGGAHFDFFLRMEDTSYAVLYTPDVAIDHPPADAGPKYRQLRQRGAFLSQMFVKHGVKRLKAVNGTVFERRPDGEMTMYCELRDRPPEGSI
jgi:GT2 family glycosyltransferase